MSETHQLPLPKDTRDQICAECGMEALNPGSVRKVQGVGAKADACRTKGSRPPKYCHNRTNDERYSCRNGGQTIINALMLCGSVTRDVRKDTA